MDEETGVTSALALDPTSGKPTERCEIIAQGAERLASWPISLQEVLRDAAKADETGGAVQRMVEVIRAIVRRPKTYGRAAVLIDKELQGICTNRFSTILARQLDLLTGTEFAQVAGLKNSQMATVQRSRHLARMLFSEGGRDIALFKPSDADDVRYRLKSRLSAQHFASDTGLGIDAVEFLVGDGLLEEVHDPIVQTLWPDQHLDPGVALEFRTKLEAAIARDEARDFPVPLFMIMHACPAGEKPWIAIIRSVLSGRVTLYANGRGKINFRECLVDAAGRKTIGKLLAPHSAPKTRSAWLSDADARERLSTTSHRLRALSSAGRLTTSGKFSGQTYARNEIDDFAAEHVGPNELQAKLRVTTRELNHILRRAGLHADVQGFVPRDATREALDLSTL